MTKVKQDAPHIAHLEAIYGLAFINSRENRIYSTDFYIRKDQAKIFYGYELGQSKIKIVHEENQKVLFVKLPQPKQVSIDRNVVSLEVTHKKYTPIDEKGNPIDVDAWMMQKLKEVVQKYEEKTISMAQTISQEYFETIAHRFGMKLKLEFTDQISRRNPEEEKRKLVGIGGIAEE
ncbi:MAG: hypothetical protein J7L96_05105 [Bacteroidales bacterium]|nr:hypothetical protein [Bacteroidales bacterium]